MRSALLLVVAVFAAAGLVDGLVDIKRGQLIESTGSDRQLFGALLHVDGDTMAVSAYAAQGFKGAVFIYRRVNGSWERVQRIVPRELITGDHFGWSLSLSGDYLLVGALWRKTNGKKQGKAYLFQRSGPGADFKLTQEFLGDDSQDGDNFGRTVRIKGKNLFVMAEQGKVAPGAVNGTGKIYYYRRENGKYVRKDVVRGERFGDQFGDEIGWTSRTLAAAAPYGDNDLNGIADTGVGYVYKWEDGQFKRKAKLQAEDSNFNDGFGNSIVINGNAKMIIIGADRANGAASVSQGAAYVFKETSGAWKLDQKISAMDGHSKGWFGYELWLTRNFLAVGSHRKDDGNIREAGAVYIYKKNNRGLYKESQVLRLSKRHAKDNFGVCVSVSGDTMVVGSPRYDTNQSSTSSADTGLDNGAIQIFKVDTNPDNAVNFLPRVVEIPSSGNFKIGVEYATKVPAVVRGQIKDGSAILSQGEVRVPAGSGIVKVELNSNNVAFGKKYTVKISLRHGNRAVKKRSIQDVKAVRT